MDPEDVKQILQCNKQLMDSQREMLERLQAKDSTIEAQQASMTALIAKIDALDTSGSTGATGTGSSSGSRGSHGPPLPIRSAEDIRKDKQANVFQNLQKTPKIKDFKLSTQDNIREWLLKIDNTIESLATAVDLKVTDIKNFEYVNMIKSKLDYVIITELNLKFAAHSPDPLKWETITKVELHNILDEQFGIREPEVSAVLRIFGSNRLKKDDKTDVRNFYAEWYEDLPLCLKPSNAAENKKLVDLIHRTSFYFALDDQYIQKKLSDIPESEQTLLKFHEEAIKAESQRLHFQQANEKGGILEGSGSISVNKFEGTTSRKWSPKGRRKFEPQKQQQQQQPQQQQHSCS